jgi:serine/threonine protein kinase
MAKQILGNEKPVRSLSDFEFVHDPNDKNSKLGVGSFASVKLAKDAKTGKMHAIKMISMQPSKVTNSDLHNIKTEITVHRILDHPNIIKFHDYIQKDHNIYFVLDYAENGNLYSYMHKRKTLPQEDIFRFFYQACSAIHYIHENDILHRDIKPENLLLDKNHNIKLCDFGWSARRITEKRTTFCGTYEYMAPEIVYKKTYDYRVDVWSLGVLLYELIHKEAPYKGRSLEEICKSLSKPQITFNSSVHPEAKDLILKILKANPQDRLSIQQILEHPWVKMNLQLKESNTTRAKPNEVKVSPREIKSANTGNPEAIQCESPKINHRKDKENFKSEIVTNGEKNPLSEHLVSPTTKKAGNSQLFNSFNGSLPVREKETEKLKERERNKEHLSVNLTTENSTLSHYKGHRRRPLQEFVSNLHLKTMKENILSSRRHTKSSSSLTSDILEKLAAANERRTPSGQTKRLFENTLLSPNFKTKVNTIVHQVSSQTTTHKASTDISSVFTSRAANQQTEPNGLSEATSTYRFHTNQQSHNKHNELQMAYRVKSDNRLDDTSKFSINSSSLNNSKAKMDSENMKGRSTPSHPKPIIQVKLNLPKGDNGITLCSPLSNPNRTARSKMDPRSPEPVELQSRHVSYSDKYAHQHKYSENHMTNREEYRRHTKEGQELTSSLTSLYKGLDYHRKHVSKFGEELNPSNQPFFVLNERKNDLRDIRRDFTRDKENRLIVKEEYERNWAH